MTLTVQLTAIILILLSILPQWRTSHWWIRVMDFPRLHLFVAGNIVLLILVIFGFDSKWDYLLASALLVGICLDAYRIFPYLPIRNKKFPTLKFHQNNSLTIVSSNVRMTNTDSDRFIQMVKEKEPDIVIALETDERWKKDLESLESVYPYTILQPQDNTYGILLYSKYELFDSKVKFLVDEKVPSLFTNIKVKDNDPIQLITLHPRPPRPAEGPSIERDAELMNVAKFVKGSNRTTIVVGDLNDVAWSHTTRLFLRVSGLLDPRKGRGFFNTFPAAIPWFRFPLDHVFHSPDLTTLKLERLKNIGSDHFPILTRLAILSQPASNRPHDESSDDLEEAEEMREKGAEWEEPSEEVKD